MSNPKDPEHRSDPQAGAGDDVVCLCFHVPLRKLTAYLEREAPAVASQLSECNGAGTGCGWCVPFLQELFERWKADPSALDTVPWNAEDYRARRLAWRAAKGVANAEPEGPLVGDDVVLEDELEW